MQDLSKFDPNVEKLQALVAESAGIVTVDINDPTQLEVVKKARIKLRDMRVHIEKTGKSYRDEATKYSRDVLEKERSLIAVIEPEEDRLKSFEDEAKKQKELDLRRQQLPERMERLQKLGVSLTEDEIMALDSVAFETKVNVLVAAKNEAVRIENERKQREIQEALRKVVCDRVDARTQRLYSLGFLHRGTGLAYENIAVTKDELEAEDSSVWDAMIARIIPLIEEKKKAATERSEKDRQEREERARQEERERIERVEREKVEREERERKELESKKAYQKFLADNGVTKKTIDDFKQERFEDGVVVLWKKVGTYRSK